MQFSEKYSALKYKIKMYVVTQKLNFLILIKIVKILILLSFQDTSYIGCFGKHEYKNYSVY